MGTWPTDLIRAFLAIVGPCCLAPGACAASGAGRQRPLECASRMASVSVGVGNASMAAAGGSGVPHAPCRRCYVRPHRLRACRRDGAVDARTAPLAAELGKALVLWDVDPQDWRQPGAGQIASYVLSHASPGAIILMHDGGGGRRQTVAALETVLAELSSRGYEFRGIPGCGGELASPEVMPAPSDDAPAGADATVTPSG